MQEYIIMDRKSVYSPYKFVQPAARPFNIMLKSSEPSEQGYNMCSVSYKGLAIRAGTNDAVILENHSVTVFIKGCALTDERFLTGLNEQRISTIAEWNPKIHKHPQKGKAIVHAILIRPGNLKCGAY